MSKVYEFDAEIKKIPNIDGAFVGGSAACIEAILADERLEAWRATLDDRVDIHGDQINI